jgi:hypothetical protein
MDGTGCSLIWGTILAFSWRDWGKAWQNFINTYITNTNQVTEVTAFTASHSLFTIIILPASSGLWQRACHKKRSSLPTFKWRDGSATGKECRDVCWREKCQQLKGDMEGVNSWDLILWPQHKIHCKVHVNIQILRAQKRQSCFLMTLPHRRTDMSEGPRIYLHLGSPTGLKANLTMQGTANTSNTTHKD